MGWWLESRLYVLFQLAERPVFESAVDVGLHRRGKDRHVPRCEKTNGFKLGNSRPRGLVRFACTKAGNRGIGRDGGVGDPGGAGKTTKKGGVENAAYAMAIPWWKKMGLRTKRMCSFFDNFEGEGCFFARIGTPARKVLFAQTGRKQIRQNPHQ